MPSKVRRTFATLAKFLQLAPMAQDYQLTDDMLPTVVVHQHYESYPILLAQEISNIASINLIGPLLDEGTYEITIQVSWAIAVALVAPAIDFWRLELYGTGQLISRVLTEGFFGQGTSLTGIFSETIRLKIAQGESLRILTSSIALNDYFWGSLKIQEI